MKSILVSGVVFLVLGGLVVGVALAAKTIPFGVAVIAVVALGILFALVASRGRFVRRK
jgi:uncharacterized membrane protein